MVGQLFLASDVAPHAASAGVGISPELLSKVWLIPTLPFLAFLVIIFVTRRYRLLSSLVSILALSGSCVLSLLVLAGRYAAPDAPAQVWSIPWLDVGLLHVDIGVLVDNPSAVMLVVVTFIGTLIQIYSTGYMDHEPDFGFAKFFAYLSLFTASMLGLVLATNFVMIYMFWELVGLSSYLLIGFWYYKKSAADAAKKAFVVTRFGDLGFLMGILMVFFLTGTLAFVGPDNALSKMAQLAAENPHLVAVAAILIFCGAVGKSAQFPLHIWLPDAMEGPTPVSALIHAATMVAAGVYLVTRCFEMFAASSTALLTVAYIGGITAFMAATMGLVQNDIKRVLAYSTVSQLGYMFLALGMGTPEGYVAGNFHLVTHAFFKALLFLCAGSVIHAAGTQDMWEMGGLRRKMPITHLTFLFGALALSGIPPFAGFWSKDEILAAAWHNPHHQVILPILGYAAALLTALYVARLYFVVFWGEWRGPAHPAEGHGSHEDHGHGSSEPHENPLNMTGPLMVLAVFAVFIGFINATLLGIHQFGSFMDHAVHAFMKPAAAAGGHDLMPVILSVVIAGLGVAIGWAFYFRDPFKSEAMLKKQFSAIWTILENKYYMDDIWAWLMRNTMFLGAQISDWVDRKIIDGIFVMGTGRVTFWAGQLLREEHSGKVQQYAMMMLIAVIVIVLGVGVAEPSFVLSPSKLLNLSNPGQIRP